MTISIIIAVKTWQKNLENCVAKCLKLDYPDFEIIILPDLQFETQELSQKALSAGSIPIEVIPTGPLNPGDKRDMGLKYAKGEIIAFIDDDAYPARDWLKRAVENFSDPQVAAVGGPAVSPPEDNLRQQASGRVYSSFMVSGNFVYRYSSRVRREVYDLPSCNFIVRKIVIEALGGFDTKYWPGEDTKLCLDITKRLGKKIIYDPRVLVYHHRRALFKGHLRQIANYALHRGYFVKKYPETSFKLPYFIPSIFVAGLVLGPLILPLNFFYIPSILIYLMLVSLSSFPKNNIKLGFMVSLGIILTHITYGIFFIKGLATKKLKN